MARRNDHAPEFAAVDRTRYAYQPEARARELFFLNQRKPPMQIRFKCPACDRHHVMDMPETTIHMTCPYGNATLKLRVTGGGDVKSEIVSQIETTTADVGESG